jgi:insulysin
MPLEEMSNKLLTFFKDIENKNLKKIDYEQHFRKENIGKWVQMQSIKDEVLMEFFWAVDSVKPYRQLHPEDYIIHVIGHEGKNSLLALLKAKDWAS